MLASVHLGSAARVAGMLKAALRADPPRNVLVCLPMAAVEVLRMVEEAA